MDNARSAADPVTLAVAEDPAPPSMPRPGLTKGQGIAIIVLLSAILTVGLVLVFLLVRRATVRDRRTRIADYLAARAHALVDLGSRELDDLLSKKEALRLEAWEPKVEELLRAPRALVSRF